LAQAARGADADALEIYELSERKKGRDGREAVIARSACDEAIHSFFLR
jgi:hypothetical protein